MDRETIIKHAKMELARREFWEYCRLTSPDFYNNERPFLHDLSDRLQWFIEVSDSQFMVVNMPPRHGKSRTATKLVQWLFGKYGPEKKVMTGSYNETLSTVFAKSVRDTISTKPAEGMLVYSDIFPKTKIKYGDAAASIWSLEGSHQANYLATSPTGTATGFGCNIMIIDDLLKSAAEAYNENTLQALIDWFNNTMMSRTETGFKVIVIMTRWATNDLAGYILSHFDNVVHINYKAVQDDGTMLCSDILSADEYKLKTKNMNKDIIAANYQQEPIDIKGRLYTNIKTYSSIPKDDSGNPLFEYILNYTDTADEGSDFLCSICYGMYGNAYYLLDLLYTQAAMEITEPQTAAMLTKNNVGCAIIESNNGGRGFARSVERICRENGNYHTSFKWFHQSQNKKARILSNSTGVMNNVLFPADWQERWPEFADDILRYQKEGKNAHDDACFPAGTMIATILGNKPIEKIKKGDYVITPYGLRKVLDAGITGEKEVIRKFGVEATRNHKFFTYNNGFVSFDALTGADESDIISYRGMIKWTIKKQLYSMGLNTKRLDQASIISVSQIQTREGKIQKAYMSQFGNITTARKFLKGIKFTTRILTQIIIISTIWSVYQLGNMLRYIQKEICRAKNTVQRLKRHLQKQEKPQKSGTKAKQVENGTRNTENVFLETRKCKLKLVLSAASHMRLFKAGQNSAAINAAKSGDVNIKDTNIQQYVSIAEKSLQERRINHLQGKAEHVQETAQYALDTKREKKKVYNLTVEGNHVYYAHGFLVSNCDALSGVYENPKPKGQTRLNRSIRGGI